MLSISNVSDTKAAGGYYEQKDDYYAGGKREGAWFGNGAKSLNLVGAVFQETFMEVLGGRLPNGTQIHRAAGGHRGGLDLTFSAPKSVSLMGILVGDQRVFDAHARAVNSTLKIAEGMAGFRITEAGSTEHQSSGNFLGAKFTHDLSRACDPQLHTHCVVMNATQRADGQWRALDNEPLYRSKMLLGAAYRAELALELKALGYGIDLTHNDGRFELAGWDAKVLKEFSQRSQAIDEYLQQNSNFPETASAVEKKLAAIATRANKENVDRDALAQMWLDRLKELDARIPEIPTTTPLLSPIVNPQPAIASVDRAIHHLSERESAFSRDQLICASIQFGVGETTYEVVVGEIDSRIKSDTLKSFGKMVTTQELQHIESMLLANEVAERTALPALRGYLPLATTTNQLTTEQADAVQSIVTNKSRLTGMVGKAGTGKTTTLKMAVDSLTAARIKVFGVAPSSNASRLLAEAGLQTTTVAAFTTNKMHEKVSQGGVLIVDEAGMLSTKQICALLEQARLHDFRLVLVGDPRQLAAVEAGKPFAQLIAAGMPTSTLKKIHRQKDPTLKRAVEFAADGNTTSAVATISHLVKEFPERNDRIEEISQAFADLSPQQRVETIVVSGTRASRERINQSIRNKLGLVGTGITVPTLEKKDLTKQQAASISSYEIGDILVANREYKSLNMKRGDQARVVAIKSTTILLSDAEGRHFDWKPTLATDLGANRLVEREIAAEDDIRVTANIHSLGLLNGDQFKVKFIDAAHKTCTIVLPNGVQRELSLVAPLPLDYAYCKTVYASQGATCDRVLIEADTASLTANQSSFYVAISRARSDVMIFTDDASSLGPAMSRSMEKTSALEVLANDTSIDII